MSEERKPLFLVVRGTVQNVMFRQTIIRACKKRDIDAGATNDPDDKNKVDLTLFGTEEKMKELVDRLKSGEKLNSWGAQVTSVEEVDSGLPPLSHKVNTENIDGFSWNPNCEFYI